MVERRADEEEDDSDNCGEHREDDSPPKTFRRLEQCDWKKSKGDDHNHPAGRWHVRHVHIDEKIVYICRRQHQEDANNHKLKHLRPNEANSRPRKSATCVMSRSTVTSVLKAF